MISSNSGCKNNNDSGKTTPNVISHESFEEMLKGMMQKPISAGYCANGEQRKMVYSQMKPVATRTASASVGVVSQAVPIVIEPGRSEGRTMKAIADTVVDNVMLSSKQKVGDNRGLLCFMWR